MGESVSLDRMAISWKTIRSDSETMSGPRSDHASDSVDGGLGQRHRAIA